MSLTNVGYLIAIMLTTLIVIFLLFRKRNAITTIFSAFTFSITFWIISNFIVDNSTDSKTIEFWLQIAIMGPVLIGPLIWNFSKLFPNKEKSFRLRTFLLSILPAAVFIPFVFSDFNVSGFNVDAQGYLIDYSVGDLYTFLGVYITIYLVLAIRNLYKEYKVSKPLAKVQIRFFVGGFLVTFITAIIATLVLPLFGNTELSIIGPLASLVSISSTTYILLRHQFLDARIFTGRIIYYLANAGIAFIGFYSVLAIDFRLFDSFYSGGTYFFGVILAIVFVLIYDRFNRYIKENVDNKIINPGFNPNEEIAKFNKGLSGLLDNEKVMSYTLETIAKTVRPTYKAFVLIRSKEDTKFSEDKDLLVKNDSEFSYILEQLSQIPSVVLNFDEIESEIPAYLSAHSESLAHVVKWMEDHSLRLIFPILDKDTDKLGYIIFGQKDGNALYNSTEVGFVKDLIDLLSTTISRAFLYEEVQQFNATLQQKVDDATKELNEKNIQLGEALRKERDMMDVLGHELRTPLGTARNAITMLDTLKQKGTLSEDKYQKYISIAQENLKREKNLLQTILQSARMENDRLQINTEKVSVDDVIDDSLVSFSKMAEQKKLQLTKALEPEEIFVKTDRTAIQQIVDNMVSNAVKYTQEGSIEVFEKKVGDKVQIGVKDTGEGIAPEDLKNIGKKFFRANPHLKSGGTIAGEKIIRPGGTGIGIYVIKGLLNAMGSELQIQSEVGKGSTFSFELPIMSPNEEVVPEKDLSNPEENDEGIPPVPVSTATQPKLNTILPESTGANPAPQPPQSQLVQQTPAPKVQAMPNINVADKTSHDLTTGNVDDGGMDDVKVA